jgi:hypothetical protein
MLRIITTIRTFINQDLKTHNKPEAIYHLLWPMFAQEPQRYTIIANFIGASDFLQLNPIIMQALRLCLTTLAHEKKITDVSNPEKPTTRTETLDDALNAGLSTVANMLPADALALTKNELIHNIALTAENMLLAIANDHKKAHPNIMLIPPAHLQPLITFVQPFNDTTALVRLANYSNPLAILRFAKSATDRPGNMTSSTIEFIKTPYYQFMENLPNQHLLQNKLKNIHRQKISTAGPDSGSITVDHKPTHTTYCFQFLDPKSGLLINTSHIFSATYQAWTSIPNYISHVDMFRDGTGKEKLIGTVENKVVLIDPSTQTCTILDELKDTDIDAACLCDSLYIYSFYNNFEELDKSLLKIYDLNNNFKSQVEVNISLDHLYYDTLSITKTDPLHMQLFGINKDKKNEIIFIDIYTIQLRPFDIQFVANKSPAFKHSMFRVEKKMPSSHIEFDLTHPGLPVPEHAINYTYINQEGWLGIVCYDARAQAFAFSIYIPSHALDMLEALKNLTTCSIEQLYAIGEVMHRLDIGTFQAMTATEQKLFNAIQPIELQNLILNFINWKTIGLYKPPIHTFAIHATKEKGSQKRPAEESADDERSPKRHKSESEDAEKKTPKSE